MTETVLSIQNLHKTFGGVVATKDFSLDINHGQIIGLIGPNGAGKNTMFNMITGIYKPDSGSIKFLGQDIVGKKPFQIANMGIARTFQNIRLFTNLSALQNVIMACHEDCNYSHIEAALHIGRYHKMEEQVRDKALELLRTVGLEDDAKRIAGSLPYGHQRRLEIARALAINPRLLLLDEPAAGMNAEESTDLCGFIMDLKQKFDLTIFLIEHHMDVVVKLVEGVSVLNFGECICQGTPDEVIRDKRVIEAYLGEEGVRAASK